jgi:hypothetical protein
MRCRGALLPSGRRATNASVRAITTPRCDDQFIEQVQVIAALATQVASRSCVSPCSAGEVVGELLNRRAVTMMLRVLRQLLEQRTLGTHTATSWQGLSTNIST